MKPDYFAHAAKAATHAAEIVHNNLEIPDKFGVVVLVAGEFGMAAGTFGLNEEQLLLSLKAMIELIENGEIVPESDL